MFRICTNAPEELSEYSVRELAEQWVEEVYVCNDEEIKNIRIDCFVSGYYAAFEDSKI